MSNRTGNGDSWAQLETWTAYRGPRAGLRSAGRGRTAMSTGPGRKAPDRKPEPPMPREGTGWAIVSYLIGGMVLYGGIGWLVGRWTNIPILFPIGLLLGIGLSLALIIFRFTRQL
jgi:ATP synthase protein I